MRMRAISLPILASALLLAIPCQATVHNVPADHPDITSALAAAVAGDEVVVAAGTYLEHDLILPSGVTLRGATGDPADVVIDGQRAGRCVYGAALDASTRLEALTLTNGLPAWGSTPYNSWGAGLMVDGGALTVANCVFTGNETAIGGGAFIKGTGTPTFVDCLFDGNQASEVAGLSLGGTCTPLVQRCIFRNATRTMVGGGLTWTGAGNAVVEDCIFEDNAVWETGGGVEVFGQSAVLTLRDCIIRRNSADLGDGGLTVGNHGRAVLERCQVVENSAGEDSGGIGVSWYSVLEAVETTIRDNTAPTGPDGGVATYALATLTCCDFDPGAWRVNGTLVVDDDGCTVPVAPATWGGVKARYR